MAHGFDKQFAQGTVVERDLAENVEDLAAQCLFFLLQLFKKSLKHGTFACFGSHEVPEPAGFRLTDTVDTAETLFKAVGVPRQVVVYHEMGALKIEAFARSVRSDENADFLILLETLFHLAAFVAHHSTVDDYHGVVIAEQGAYLVREVAERVAVFGKNDQLFAEPLCIEHSFFVLQQTGKLFPFTVSAAGADGVGLGFQRFEHGNFRFQLRDGSRGTGLVSYAFFGVFQLGGSQVVIVEFVRKVQVTQFVPVAGTLAEPFFAETVFQSFAAAVQRLIDGLGRRRETPLEHGEREAHGGAAFVVQIVGAIEFVLNVGGHSLVEFGLFGGKAVVHRDGVALREEGRTVELE